MSKGVLVRWNHRESWHRPLRFGKQNIMSKDGFTIFRNIFRGPDGIKRVTYHLNRASQELFSQPALKPVLVEMDRRIEKARRSDD